MTTTREPVDKTGWGDGPWMTEPDRVEWEHAGLPCLIVRSAEHGNFCGYAAVPPGHPAHGKRYMDVDVEVHGGLTYGNECQGRICHVPKPGEPDDVFWFGFDCGHAWDLQPGLRATLGKLGCPPPFPGADDDVYRDLAYVTAEVNRLAEQLAAMATRERHVTPPTEGRSAVP